ncbi:MAG TPA: hypothetical protein PLK82_12725, partial [Bacteroidales bacterium]|nr:hypothetical protein [Bacteroidales bacterium]
RGEAIHQKTDIFQKILWYSYADDPGNMVAVPVEDVRYILAENKKGNFPEKLEDYILKVEPKGVQENIPLHDDLTRFDNQ